MQRLSFRGSSDRSRSGRSGRGAGAGGETQAAESRATWGPGTAASARPAGIRGPVAGALEISGPRTWPGSSRSTDARSVPCLAPSFSAPSCGFAFLVFGRKSTIFPNTATQPPTRTAKIPRSRSLRVMANEEVTVFALRTHLERLLEVVVIER